MIVFHDLCADAVGIFLVSVVKTRRVFLSTPSFKLSLSSLLEVS